MRENAKTVQSNGSHFDAQKGITMATSQWDYKFYDDEAAERFSKLSKNGAIAVFIYSSNVYTNGETQKYDESSKRLRAVAVGGVTYVPTVFF